ncbi:MAG: FAD-binding oxidoreductase [Geodermatophilaceae bacterium]|nr:FAD-binding oxidoreductase [Geodermatophilaceae bacterium]
MRVCVVGAGVIGLSCAIRAAEAGHSVHIVSAQPAAQSVSAVAAALWFPYRASPQERVLAWSMTSLRVFRALADDPESGVALRYGTELHRREKPDLWWAEQLTDLTLLGGGELSGVIAPNPEVLGGLRARLPILVMSRYLGWLEQRCADLGVAVSAATLDSLTGVDPTADAVVLAIGLGAGDMLGDSEVTPIRGQVVRLGNPGLTDWLLDEDDPTQFCYVIPRFDDVVCGGTAEVGQSSLEPDMATEAAILARARRLVPDLADAPIVSRAVGLRPGRREVRLERCDDLDRTGRLVVACYGHGGAGVTMSWGCADEVVGLLAG